LRTPIKDEGSSGGLMLSDATIRMHGNQALMGIQQTHQELTQEALWREKCVFN
jgi:hypothetical protein